MRSLSKVPDNLDDFLDLVDESRLLVTFNGSSFDLPFIERSYNIPSIGCAHVDLRWIAYHQGLEGGLKVIEKKLAVPRPPKMRDIDGFEAVMLFHRWQRGDQKAKKKLIEYCSADSIATYLVAIRILQQMKLPFPNVSSSAIFKQITSPQS